MPFCSGKESDPFPPSVGLLLDSLLRGFGSGGSDLSGLSYWSVTVFSSAIASVALIDGLPAGRHPLVCRFMRAVCYKKPAFPRYQSVWDPDVVLDFIKQWGLNESLSLINLSKKLAMLMLLQSGQRGQTLLLLDIQCMRLDPARVVFHIKAPLKTSRPGFHMSEVAFDAFEPDRGLCVVDTIESYLSATADLRGDVTSLFIISRAPYTAASRDTVSRWVRSLLLEAGVDVGQFAPGSTRHAAASKAAGKLSVEDILKAVGWRQESTFASFYRKPVRQRRFAAAVMGSL